MGILKIDQGARREDRRAESARILREAVWGDSTTPVTLKRVLGALVRWHAEAGSGDPLNDAISTMVESASLGLLRKTGDRWRPAR